MRAVVAAGKPVSAFVPHIGEQEYAVASACSKILIPPSASVALRGLSVSAAFLRSALDNLGLKPEV